MNTLLSRRDFVRLGAGATVAGAASRAVLLEPALLAAQTEQTGRKIRFVSIGTGIRGCDLLRSARKVPSCQLVGHADLYEMHRKAGQEAYGADVPVTGDYRALLDRKDVDAVIVAVSDHLHRSIVLDCLAAGKDVYCEKPMSHNVADGFAMVEAVKANKRIFQAGSQRVSNIVYKKAPEIYASGRLGKVTYIEGHSDRNSPSGAWVYPIPPDASEADHRLESLFARRARSALSTRCGFSAGGASLITEKAWPATCSCICCRASSASAESTAAPKRAQSIGSLTYFKDGRDFPDLLATLYEYDGVTLNLHCNQNNAQGEPIIFYGKEATMTINGNTLTVAPQDTRPQPEGYSLNGWTAAAKKQYLDEWHAAHPRRRPRSRRWKPIRLRPGYDDTADHLANFFRAVDTREPVVEDEIFGNHAAIACHMANYSYFHRSAAILGRCDQNHQRLRLGFSTRKDRDAARHAEVF